jgi:hypothetical protein
MGDPPAWLERSPSTISILAIFLEDGEVGECGTLVAKSAGVTNLDLHLVTSRSSRSGLRTFLSRTAVIVFCMAGVFACSAADDLALDEDGDVDDDGEDQYEATSDELKTAGPCSGKEIDRAVKCATAKGARVLSYYRSPADQERVRRENGCTNRCTGMAGCVRPTANCTSSPHTSCRAVDLVNDGAPLTKAQLRACGLAKTTMPHKNHYDLVGQ